MKCQSGKHDWTDPRDAARCCSGAWARRLVPWGENPSYLDPETVRFHVSPDGSYYTGWARVDPPSKDPGDQVIGLPRLAAGGDRVAFYRLGNPEAGGGGLPGGAGDG